MVEYYAQVFLDKGLQVPLCYGAQRRTSFTFFVLCAHIYFFVLSRKNFTKTLMNDFLARDDFKADINFYTGIRYNLIVLGRIIFDFILINKSFFSTFFLLF